MEADTFKCFPICVTLTPQQYLCIYLRNKALNTENLLVSYLHVLKSVYVSCEWQRWWCLKSLWSQAQEVAVPENGNVAKDVRAEHRSDTLGNWCTVNRGELRVGSRVYRRLLVRRSMPQALFIALVLPAGWGAVWELRLPSCGLVFMWQSCNSLGPVKGVCVTIAVRLLRK